MAGTTRGKIVERMKRLLRCNAARRLLRQQDGAAAIEFGLVAAPFLALVFAILETAIVFFAGQALETAAADSARLIMTGQAQTQGYRRGQVQDRGVQQDLRLVQLQQRYLCRRQELHVVRQHQHRQSGQQRQSADRQLRLLARQCRRDRGGAADVSMAGLRVAARPQPCRPHRRQAPDDPTVAFRNEPYYERRRRPPFSRPRPQVRSAGCATSAACPRSNSPCCCR